MIAVAKVVTAVKWEAPRCFWKHSKEKTREHPGKNFENHTQLLSNFSIENAIFEVQHSQRIYVTRQ
jgi:hypothetical protein